MNGFRNFHVFCCSVSRMSFSCMILCKRTVHQGTFGIICWTFITLSPFRLLSLHFVFILSSLSPICFCCEQYFWSLLSYIGNIFPHIPAHYPPGCFSPSLPSFPFNSFPLISIPFHWFPFISIYFHSFPWSIVYYPFRFCAVSAVFTFMRAQFLLSYWRFCANDDRLISPSRTCQPTRWSAVSQLLSQSSHFWVGICSGTIQWGNLMEGSAT